MHKRLVILEDLEFSAADDEAAVARHSTNASHLFAVLRSNRLECLHTTIVKDRPNLNGAIRIRSNNIVETAETINAD